MTPSRTCCRCSGEAVLWDGTWLLRGYCVRHSELDRLVLAVNRVRLLDAAAAAELSSLQAAAEVLDS